MTGRKVDTMKKIVKGKMYDTQTAKRLGEHCVNSASDFDYLGESLYRKRTGEFFLYGEGGARTKYAHLTEDGHWIYGQDIIPLSYKAACEWAEEHLTADEYQAIFGEVSEDGEDVMLSVRVPAALAETLRREAAQKGTTQQALVVELLRKL